jgi:putative ABC transport system permease protein
VRVSRASQASRELGQFVPGTVVGVVRDIHQISQDVLPVAEVYVPYTLEPWGWGSLVVRADRSALPAMREAVRSVDTRLVAESDREPFSPVENAIESGLQPRVVAIRFVAAFAATGLLLACLGLYGVIAYNVGQRGREIALRKAMGATDGGVVRLLARDSAAMVAGGTIAGGVGAWASTRWIRPLLFHTTAYDPAVYALAILALVIMAMIATLLPARRVNAIDPAIVLRGE